MQAEAVDPFGFPRIIPGNGVVAAQASLTLFREGGQGISALMASAALPAHGLVRLEAFPGRIAEGYLIMGIMAAQAVSVRIRGLDLKFTVDPSVEIVHDCVMAGKALLRLEKIACPLCHIPWVRMEIQFANVFMAFLTPNLSVHRCMKPLRINYPRCPGPWNTDKKTKDHGQQMDHSANIDLQGTTFPRIKRSHSP